MITANKDAATTLVAYYRDAYRPCQLVGCSQKTLAAYSTTLKLWERWEGHMPLDRINSRVLAQFAEWLLPGRSPASVNSYLRPITAMLRYAADEDDIEKAPRFRRLKEPKRSPLAFTVEEFAAILRIAKQIPGTICGIRAKIWWPCLLRIGWESGLRIRSLLSVANHDVLLDQNGLYCQAENQKDREADWFPLSESTMGLVRAIHDLRHELLLPVDVTIECLRSRFRKIMELAGIYAPKGAGMAFHRIRKSTASHVAAAGGDAQRKLGHSSPKITERYLDPRITRASKPHELIPAPSPSCNGDDSPVEWKSSSSMAGQELEESLRKAIAASTTAKYRIEDLAGIARGTLYSFLLRKRHLQSNTAEKLRRYFGIDDQQDDAAPVAKSPTGPEAA